MIIDWEHHYLPEELWVKKGGKKGERTILYEHGRPRTTLNPVLYDIEKHIEVMDETGIDVAVLSMAGTPDDIETALEECKVWDDKVSELIRMYPKRFVGIAPVHPLGGERALAELDRTISFLGFKGVIIRSQLCGFPLDSQELWPFYKKLSYLNVPLFIHTTGAPLGFDILSAPYDLGRSIGRELDLIVAIARIIFSGVMENFPDLTFVISHMGGGISAIKERIERYFGPEAEEATPGTLISKPFQEYFDKLYFDMGGYGGGMNAVNCALTTINPHRLVFATDYPQNFTANPAGIKTYIENIKKLNIDEESKALILGGNASMLLGL